MLNITRFQFKVVAVVCVITLMFLCSLIFHNWTDKPPRTVPTPMKQRTSVVYPVNLSRPPLPSQLPSSVSCTCPADSVFLKDHVPKEQREELLQRRAKEFQQHKARTSSVLSRLLFALPNSPLQYPIQGFTVRPLTSTLIPGLGLYAEKRSSYKVLLTVSKGILRTEIPAEAVTVKGSGEKGLMLESSNLVVLNDLLAKVSYTSTVYHINTGDLVLFQFEEHEAVFPIAIKQPGPPVLYDMGTDINSQVTVLTKTFLRYRELNLMLNSIRRFYSKITVIIADDSLKPEPVTGENIHHYIMPPAQGWFAGRNLAVSQVTTKYFLWVDDDFLFTEDTKIEKFVEVMEAVPELDVLGGSVQGNQFHFSILYEEGEEMDGGCLIRKSHGKFHSLPGYPNCFLANGVVNFFLARTDAIQKVGFDPKLRRAAHSEFFMDGLGSLMVATCGHVSIGHQHWDSSNALYAQFRYPGKADQEFKLQLHFFKNHLKCMKYA